MREGRTPDSSGRELSGEFVAQWRDLAERRANAFLLPEWYSTWMRHYGAMAEPQIVSVAAADGGLLGLLPLVAERKRLRFAGANLGDHFGPLAREGHELEVAAAAAGRLGGDRHLILDHVDRSADWLTAMVGPSRSLRSIVSRVDVLPHIDLAGKSWDDYMDARSRNFRSQLGRKLRKLEREHGAVFRRTREPGGLSADLDTFFALHDARWTTRGGSSVATERARLFHRDFAAALLERGWLRLWFLELDGRAAATWYGWNVGGRYAYYLGGFDPEWEKQSVGFVLLAHTIRSATEEQAYEYDFLRGGEEYKGRFAAEAREIETVVLAPRVSLARATATVDAVVWQLSRRLSERSRDRGRRLYKALPGTTTISGSR